MKRSDLNHLRRLVAWVQCEIGQSPDELVATVRTVADKLGHPDISPEAKQRLVESHDKARQVPKYVRDAVKALDRYARPPGYVVDEQHSPSSPDDLVLALLDREIEDARKAGVRFVRDAVFREAAEKRLAVLEDLRPKVQALRELPESAGSLKQGGLQTPACWCESCDAAANSGLLSRMSLCPQCGNKRCPRATHHNNACTGSNEPCQPGSSWEHCRPAEKLQVEQKTAGAPS